MSLGLSRILLPNLNELALNGWYVVCAINGGTLLIARIVAPKETDSDKIPQQANARLKQGELKMKNRIFVLIAAVAIFAVAVFVPSSTLATAVPIPQQLNSLVAGLILVAVTAGFVWLFQYVGLDLRDQTVPISGALSAFILAEAQKWINLIPAQYDTFVTITFNIIIVILSGIGTLYIVARHASKAQGPEGVALLKD